MAIAKAGSLELPRYAIVHLIEQIGMLKLLCKYEYLIIKSKSQTNLITDFVAVYFNAVKKCAVPYKCTRHAIFRKFQCIWFHYASVHPIDWTVPSRAL